MFFCFVSYALGKKQTLKEPFCKPDYLDLERLVQQETLLFFFFFLHPGLDISNIVHTEVCGFASVSSHAKTCLKSEYKCFSDAKVCQFYFFKRSIEEQIPAVPLLRVFQDWAMTFIESN